MPKPPTPSSKSLPKKSEDFEHILGYNFIKYVEKFRPKNLRILVASGARALALFSPSCCAVVALGELGAKETRLEKAEAPRDGWLEF